jgi:hypothetical protein
MSVSISSAAVFSIVEVVSGERLHMQTTLKNPGMPSARSRDLARLEAKNASHIESRLPPLLLVMIFVLYKRSDMIDSPMYRLMSEN